VGHGEESLSESRKAGSDIDDRFVLPNERAFLAWIRTSPGIIAGGVALD